MSVRNILHLLNEHFLQRKWQRNTFATSYNDLGSAKQSMPCVCGGMEHIKS